MIDLTNVNRYSVEELAAALLSGECTYDDYIQAWLSWDKRAALEQVVKEMEPKQDKQDMINEEAMDWSNAESSRTIEGYELYKQKWSAPCRKEYAQHLQYAEARIDYLIREKEYRRLQMKYSLLMDMRENPWRYRQELLRILLSGNLTDRMLRYIQEKEFDQPYAKFLLAGGKLKMSDLIQEDVIPKDLTSEEILAPDYSKPATQFDVMGELPQNRTDVYFLGLPRSGKSSIIASIAYNLSHFQPKAYVPQVVNGIDISAEYYNCLIEAIQYKKTPQGTANDTVSFAKLDLARSNSRKKTLLNLVDYSGTAFQAYADKYIMRPVDLEKWENSGFFHYIANNNRKVFFFVLDFSIISDTNPENQISTTKQIEELERALNVFTTDGPDPKNPRKDCTLTKVDTVAVIMTKCDLMNVDSQKDRLYQTMQYISVNFNNFMVELSRDCKIFGINKSNNYSPYIMAYSLGKFYVGNTCVINEENPTNLIDFLANVTPENQSSKWWKF